MQNETNDILVSVDHVTSKVGLLNKVINAIAERILPEAKAKAWVTCSLTNCFNAACGGGTKKQVRTVAETPPQCFSDIWFIEECC